MLFTSFGFLFLFLPITLAVSRLLHGRPLLGWICLASLVFYALTGHAWFLVPMSVTTLLDFFVGRRLQMERRPGRRRMWLLVSLCGNLGVLAYFKYAGLLLHSAESVAGLLGHAHKWPALSQVLSVTLPAGISFYTFQTMSYVIDIYRRDAAAEPSFFRYLAFVAFFPHLVAGPLTRHNQLIPQLGAIADHGTRPRWQPGVVLFSIGFIKKVLLADRIAEQIDPLIATLPGQGSGACWLALIGYSLQIYFDFSGYSDMAIGLGRLFGIELPINFNSPYQACNPSDFWRRWHITLSQWLRDYLYISLGGNRGSAPRVQANLMITMVLGGLWHGASWTFALWGMYHGGLLVLYRRWSRHWDRLPAMAQQGLMYLLCCLGWVLFRAPDAQVAGDWFAGLFGWRGIGNLAPLRPLAALCAGGLWLTMGCRNAATRKLTHLSPVALGLLGFVTAAAVVCVDLTSKFLYFQF